MIHCVIRVLVNCEKNKKSKRSDNLHPSKKKYKNCVSYVSYIQTSLSKHTVLDLLNVCSNYAPLNYSGQESKNNLQFTILTYLWSFCQIRQHLNYLPWICAKVKNTGIFIIYYRGQESKTRNLQFTFLTNLWPWNKVKVIKHTRQCRPQARL